MKYMCSACDKVYDKQDECAICEKSHKPKTFTIWDFTKVCYDRRSFDDYAKTLEAKIYNSSNRQIYDIRNIDGYAVFYEMVNAKGKWFYLEPENEYYCKWNVESVLTNRTVTYHTSCGNECTVGANLINGDKKPDTCKFCGKPTL